MAKKSLWCFGLVVLVGGLALADGGGEPSYYDTWPLFAQAKGKVGGVVSSGQTDPQFDPVVRYAEYDDRGSIKRFYPFGPGGGIRDEFSYDPAGKLIKVLNVSFDDESKTSELLSSTSYTYNAKGQLVAIESEFGGQATEAKATIDAQGNSVFVDKNQTGEDEFYVSIVVYSPNLKVLEETLFQQNKTGTKKNLVQRAVHSYDAAGNRIKTAITQGADPGTTKDRTATISYTYTFDKAGNKASLKVTLFPAEPDFYYQDFAIPKAINFAYLGPGQKATQAEIDMATKTMTPPPAKNTPAPAVKTVQSVPKNVEVLWTGQWYKATVLKTDGTKYFIHYNDYDSSWDEWVGPDRIRY